MKVYVAAQHLPYAQGVAWFIEKIKVGKEYPFSVVSRWHDNQVGDFGKHKDSCERADIAAEDLEDVEKAQILVLCGGYSTQIVKGGKFVEAGYALALGKKVIVLGPDRENLLLYHKKVLQVLDLGGLQHRLFGIGRVTLEKGWDVAKKEFDHWPDDNLLGVVSEDGF